MLFRSTVHALRCVFRNAAVAAHSLPLILAVFVVFGHVPGPEALLAFAGLALVAANAFALSIVLGMVCARFRDIPPIVASVMQIAFFVSPIIWKPELLSGVGREFLPLNPFYTLLEVVRGPLLNQVPGGLIWLSACGWSLVLILAAWVCFVRVRSRLAFWV